MSPPLLLLSKFVDFVQNVEGSEDYRQILLEKNTNKRYVKVGEDGEGEVEVLDLTGETITVGEDTLIQKPFETYTFNDLVFSTKEIPYGSLDAGEGSDVPCILLICSDQTLLSSVIAALLDKFKDSDIAIQIIPFSFISFDESAIEKEINDIVFKVENTFLFLDSWLDPSFLKDSLSLLFIDKVISLKKSDIDVLYDKSVLALEDLYSQNNFPTTSLKERFGRIDLSNLDYHNEMLKTFFMGEIIKNELGFLSVSNNILQKLTECYISQVLLARSEVKDKRDHIQMEKRAISCYEMGQFLISVESYREAVKVLHESVHNYRELQKYRDSRPANPEEELPELEQAEYDRINGGLCTSLAAIVEAGVKANYVEANTQVLEDAEAEASKVKGHFHFCFLKLHFVKALISAANNDRLGETKTLLTISLVLKDTKQPSDILRRAKAELRLTRLLLRSKEAKQEEILMRVKHAQVDFQTCLPVCCQQYVETLVIEAHVYYERKDFDTALEVFLTAKAAVEEHLGELNHELAKVYTHLGQTYSVLGSDRFDEALGSYQKSIELYEVLRGISCDEITVPLNYLGNLLADTQPEEAVKVLTRAHEILSKNSTKWERYDALTRRKLKSRHASVLSNLGQVLLSEGESERAIEMFENCCLVTEEVLGADHETTKRRKERLEQLKSEV